MDLIANNNPRGIEKRRLLPALMGLSQLFLNTSLMAQIASFKPGASFLGSMGFTLKSAGSPAEKRKTIISLQWFVVIGTSYLTLFTKEAAIEDPWVLFLVTSLMASILVLHRVPESGFDSRLFNPLLVIWDTVTILFGIGLNRDTPWDWYLLFFLCLFIAGIGESLIKIVSGCLLLSLAFAFMTISQNSSSWSNSELLLRIPFIFGVSILYGYLAEQVKNEKKRADQAVNTETIKRQLVSALAHDIKNPLAVVVGYTEIVADRLAHIPAQDENLAALQRIHGNAERILKLVTGFLDASKAEAGKGAQLRQPVQLNRLIREVAQQQMVGLHQKNINLNLELDTHLPEITGEEAQLDRVLWNLVGNAIKFTPSGGSITISSHTENNHVSVTVKDTGVEIPKEDLPLLFSEFRRLKGAAKIEGTGLGLFIVKTIVEGHGGTVHADSDVERETTFTIRFPARS